MKVKKNYLAEEIKKVKDQKSSLEKKLQYACAEALKEAIKEFKDGFVKNIAVANEIDNIFPENTKFSRTYGDYVVFVIEQKPSVKTLTFCQNFHEGIIHSGTYRLSLPYVVFIPVFHCGSFNAMFVAYRNAPLRKIDDMLYYPNLPNVYNYASSSLNTFEVVEWPKEGNVKNLNDLKICQGFVDKIKNISFSVKSSTYPVMCEKVINHFWSSEFTDELTLHYQLMQYKDPKNFGTLRKWETATKNDPLFTLNVKWLEAIRLDKLLGLFEYAFGSRDYTTTNTVANVYKAAWGKILDNWPQKFNLNIDNILSKKLEEILKKFSIESSNRLSFIDNEFLRNQMILIIKESLIKASGKKL